MEVYHWYAETYQWPPEVVRKLSLKEDFWLRTQKDALVAAQATLDREAQAIQQ
jgi:hypothetical protein